MLQLAIEKIKAEAETMSSAQSNAGGDARKGKAKGTSMVGKSPPCLSFADVLTLQELVAYVEVFYSCETKADMLMLQKNNRTKKKPVNELISSCNSTLVALKKAFEKISAMADASATGKGRGGRGKGARVGLYITDAPRPGSILFDLAPEGAVEVPHVDSTFGEKSAEDFKQFASSPLLIKLSPETLAAFSAGGLQTSLDAFVKDYTASEDRTTKRRGGRRFPDPSETLTQARDIMLKILPSGCVDTSDPSIQANIGPSWFAVTKGELQFYKEPDVMPALRLCLKGTRTLVMAKIGDMLAFMGTVGMAAENALATRACTFMKGMTAEQIAQYKKKGKFHCITAGVGDAVYVPMGWAVCEKIGEEDTFGLAFRGLVAADLQAAAALAASMVGMKDSILILLG